jgi:LytS/YehU family sensor histidine kinase
MQNPVITNRQAAGMYLLTWSVVIIMNIILLFMSTSNSALSIISESLVANILFAAMGLGLWFPVLYGRMGEGERRLFTITWHIFACIASVALWIGIQYVMLVYLFGEKQEYAVYLKRSIPWKSATGIFYYCTIVMAYYLMIYYNNVRTSAVKESRLETLVRESELSSLKAQINPHFLFNSLNSISSLTITSPEKAQEMIIKLSEFLRYSIAHRNENLTTLEEELANLNRYIDIEKVRFGKRLEVKQEIDNSALMLKIPALMLQPLMENALKYSMYDITGPVTIELEIREQPEVLWIRMKNRFDPESGRKKGAGIGLSNIRKRLSVQYNRDDLMMQFQENDIFEIQIVIPQKRN